MIEWHKLKEWRRREIITDQRLNFVELHINNMSLSGLLLLLK